MPCTFARWSHFPSLDRWTVIGRRCCVEAHGILRGPGVPVFQKTPLTPSTPLRDSPVLQPDTVRNTEYISYYTFRSPTVGKATVRHLRYLRWGKHTLFKAFYCGFCGLTYTIFHRFKEAWPCHRNSHVSSRALVPCQCLQKTSKNHSVSKKDFQWNEHPSWPRCFLEAV